LSVKHLTAISRLNTSIRTRQLGGHYDKTLHAMHGLVSPTDDNAAAAASCIVINGADAMHASA